MLEGDLFRVWGSDQRDRLALIRQDRGCQGQPVIQTAPRLVELVGDRVACSDRKSSLLHQVADKKAIAFFGGHTPCRSVGLTDETELGERVHLVAHRGRADLQTVIFNQSLGRDRLCRAGMLVHDQ